MTTRWVFILTFVPLLLLYGFTRARTVTGEDSGELITAAYDVGIAHPPGYPLWILLAKASQVVFGGLNPADATNLFSSITTAAALGLLAVLAFQILGVASVSIAAAWWVGIGHEIWNHATIAEVYPLNLLILVACLLLYRSWREAGSRKDLFWLSLVYGVGLSHHPTFLLFLPVFAAAVLLHRPSLLRDPKSLAVGAGALLLPFLAYVQVAVAAAGHPFVSWGVKPTLGSVAGHYLRDAYAAGPAKTPQALAKLGGQLEAFARFHVHELTLIGCVLAAMGMALLVRRDRLFGALCFLIVITGSLGIIPLTNFDLEREDVFVNRVFLMPAYLVLGLGLATGAAWLLKKTPDRVTPSLASVLLLIPVAGAAVSYPIQDRSDDSWAEDYGRAVLEGLPKEAALIPGGDTQTFPVIYLHRCLGVRPDVLILDRSGTLLKDEALALLPEASRIALADESRETFIASLMRSANRPVVTLRKHKPPPGIELQPCGLGFLAINSGSRSSHDHVRRFQADFIEGLHLRNEDLETVSDYTADIVRSHVWQVRARQRFADGDPPGAVALLEASARYGAGIKETQNNIGALLAENGLAEFAIRHFRAALEIRDDYHLARRNLVVTLRRQGQNEEALEEATVGIAQKPGDRLVFDEGVKAAFELGDGAALAQLCRARGEAIPGDGAVASALTKWADRYRQLPDDLPSEGSQAVAASARAGELPAGIVPPSGSPSPAGPSSAPAWEYGAGASSGRARRLAAVERPQLVPGQADLDVLVGRIGTSLQPPKSPIEFPGQPSGREQHSPHPLSSRREGRNHDR